MKRTMMLQLFFLFQIFLFISVFGPKYGGLNQYNTQVQPDMLPSRIHQLFHKRYMLFSRIQEVHSQLRCILDVYTAPSHFFEALVLTTPEVSKQPHRNLLFVSS